MRRPAPDTRPVALTIAGSDSGGGAGIQADLAAFAAEGAYGTSVVTAVTAQHTRGVERTHVLPRADVEAQLSAVAEDFAVGAAKTGMLATAEIVEAVADRASGFEFPLVVDPVMVAGSGDRLLEPEAERAYEDLLAEATLVTPNVAEAEVLTGVTVDGDASAREAGERLLEAGADAALVTGGHRPGDRVRDVLVTDGGAIPFESGRVDTDATHGSGCTLSAAIAARLAAGEDLHAAVSGATGLVSRAIRYHHDAGRGPGAVNHLAGIRNEAARRETAAAVADLVERFVEADVSRLVPEVGTNVVGATPYAESVDEVAAVDGRIARVRSGVAPTRGVRFGASSHVARFLLGAREFVPALRFAANVRFDDAVEAALADLEWPVAEYDRDAEPPATAGVEGETMDWAARQAFADRDRPPVATIDRGAVGKEPMTKLVAADADALAERVLALEAAVAE